MTLGAAFAEKESCIGERAIGCDAGSMTMIGGAELIVRCLGWQNPSQNRSSCSDSNIFFLGGAKTTVVPSSSRHSQSSETSQMISGFCSFNEIGVRNRSSHGRGIFFRRVVGIVVCVSSVIFFGLLVMKIMKDVELCVF